MGCALFKPAIDPALAAGVRKYEATFEIVMDAWYRRAADGFVALCDISATVRNYHDPENPTLGGGTPIDEGVMEILLKRKYRGGAWLDTTTTRITCVRGIRHICTPLVMGCALDGPAGCA